MKKIAFIALLSFLLTSVFAVNTSLSIASASNSQKSELLTSHECEPGCKKACCSKKDKKDKENDKKQCCKKDSTKACCKKKSEAKPNDTTVPVKE